MRSNMTTEELKKYFKTGYRFEKLTEMTANSFRNWAKWGYIPMDSQCKIELFTGGKLKADYEHARPNCAG